MLFSLYFLTPVISTCILSINAHTNMLLLLFPPLFFFSLILLLFLIILLFKNTLGHRETDIIYILEWILFHLDLTKTQLNKYIKCPKPFTMFNWSITETMLSKIILYRNRPGYPKWRLNCHYQTCFFIHLCSNKFVFALRKFYIFLNNVTLWNLVHTGYINIEAKS